jgi:hypothetical protein
MKQTNEMLLYKGHYHIQSHMTANYWL